MLFSRSISRRGLARFPGVRRNPPRRTMIPAPGPNTGPLMERRADRELPSIDNSRRWLRSLPIFVVAVGAAMLGIFNYQKSTSSVVSSTLYALRTSPRAREILGDEIYFAQQIPWISGEMNQLHGRIDITFWVKGTKSQGKMRFRSIRPDRMSFVSHPESFCASILANMRVACSVGRNSDWLTFRDFPVPHRGMESTDRGWNSGAAARQRQRSFPARVSALKTGR